MNAKLYTLARLLALLALAYAAYWPGLSGDFLFDDFVNLNAIGATGPVDNWAGFLRYITSGTADPTGRPLALLSFLIDAQDWPAEPAPFLHTNLLIHLLNGMLLFQLLRSLGRWLEGDDQQNIKVALLGAGLWLLHPLFVSTTLYAVQREAMLPATFILLGLIAYSRGRWNLGSISPLRAVSWMAGGIVGGTALALLCKGNGILLPTLALVLELTIFGRRNISSEAQATVSRVRWTLLLLPTAALLMYLASFLVHFNTVVEHRGWSIAQRLMTESRILVDYLQLLFVPRSISSGLYNDAYVVSTGLTSPISTLPCLLLVLGLPLLALRYRARYPVLSAATLFYFAGQLLESSTIPLELYFEHRNYIPALLLFWPVARALFAQKSLRRWQSTIALSLLGLLALTTFNRAEIWGQPRLLASVWSQQNIASSRAQATVAMMDTSAGRYDLAMYRLGPIWKRQPADLQIAFNYVNAACAGPGLLIEDSKRLESALLKTAIGLGLINRWLGNAIDTAQSGQCPGLTLTDTERWLNAVSRNPNAKRMDFLGQDIEPLLAQLAMSKKQPDLALKHFNLSLWAYPTPDVAARQASMLARNGYFAQALAHLDAYERVKSQVATSRPGMPRIHAYLLRRQNYWPHEMSVLRAKLQAEIDASHNHDSSGQ